jgi:hypothetical protein
VQSQRNQHLAGAGNSFTKTLPQYFTTNGEPALKTGPAPRLEKAQQRQAGSNAICGGATPFYAHLQPSWA